jgi:hypothetical protein
LSRLDSVAIALVHRAMAERRDLVLHGPVSRRLLENLEEFQMAWASWKPEAYRPVEIRAEREEADQPAELGQPAIAAFSGGVDASFTVWRHHKGAPGRYHRRLGAAVLVQGFDIPLGAQGMFAVACDGARAMLDELGVPLLVLKTNLQQFLPHWEMNFGAGVAACLHQFAEEYAFGLIASDEPYSQLVLPWGSNPITTPLLSSRSFEIVYDGTGYTRTERAMHLAGWEGAMRHLRVCWEGPRTGRNCCRCEKCIRTILNFRAAGVPKPAAFEQDVTDEQIRGMRLRNPAQYKLLKEILDFARARGGAAPWLAALEDALRANRSVAG